ncbi:MAG: PAS domain S-box protein [Thermoplasmatota archaeon]
MVHNRSRPLLQGTLIWLGILAAVVYWIMEAAVDAVFFAGQPFVEELVSPAPHEMWMRSIGAGLLVVLGVVAQMLMNRKGWAEGERHRLNRALRAIRKVNQVLIRAQDRDTMLQQVCNTLIEGRGYYNAWIAVKDADGGFSHTAEAGRGKQFPLMQEKLQAGWLPSCGERALSSAAPVVVEEPPWNCPDCPSAEQYAGRAAIACRLSHAGETYGFLCASVPKHAASDEWERGLFEEMSDDVAFVLHKLALEEQQARAERKLRESEERYRRLFEAAQDGILILDASSGEIVDANPYLGELIGYSKKELKGRHLWDIGTFKDIVENKEKFDKLRDEGYVRYEHLPLQTKDGEEAAVEFVSNTYQAGGKTVIQCNIRDITPQKRAERKLRRRSAAIDASIDGVAILDEEERYVYLNPAHAHIYGYDSPEELAEETWRVLYDEEWQTWFEEEVMPQVWETGRWRGEAVGLKKDGSRFPQEVSLTALDDGGLICVVRDISQQKRAQQELKESEKKYREIFHNANDAMYLHRLTDDGMPSTFIEVNDVACEMLGYTHEEFREMSPRDIDDPEAAVNVPAVMQEILDEGHTTFETRHVAKDGSRVPVEISSHTFTLDGERLVLSIARDITERKEAEEELRRSEQEKTLILDTSPALIVYQDPGHRVIWANREAAESVNESPEDLEGRKCYEVWHKRKEPCESCPVEGAIETGEMRQGEMTSPDGRYWLIRGNPVRDDDGNIVGAVETTLDITERKQAEEEMERALENERVFKLQAAHHFFNPIAISRGYMDIVMEKLPDGEAEMIQKAHDAIMRIQRVVENIVQRGEIHE